MSDIQSMTLDELYAERQKQLDVVLDWNQRGTDEFFVANLSLEEIRKRLDELTEQGIPVVMTNQEYAEKLFEILKDASE